ncbi:MarR family winged helix-turn-helix transcriptional regulator [Nocardia cyriacigeorgica]|uniref:MarR family winged helix-turn-helix transcriptional regulator n=1 Tax=Nocardia cyriacigeorgica TaxID=135487 RepID=UPI001895D9F7|nr:MarR family winged helix-turn-helix transcriptional regulator [Nocardia cyriacigeorgica]MBF6439459.1 winged helix-turn-helix transcriptional regulator [Nocardia cyriacigeorgica]
MDQKRRAPEHRGDPERPAIETEIGSDLRALTAVSEQLGHVFARSNNLRPNDFRALLHIATAEFEGVPLTPGRLGRLMGMSSAAVTYLVERMIDTGHLRRDADDTDRRKVLLRHDEQGRSAAEDFFIPVGTRTRAALAEFSDDDLRTTHRVLTSVIAALRNHLDEVTAPDR